MRIGLDAKRLFRNSTGLGNYSRFLVKALCSRYPQNHYLLFSTGGPSQPEASEILNGPNVEAVLPSRAVRVSGLSSLWRVMRSGQVASRKGIELFHGLSHELPIDLPDRVPSAVTVHDLIPHRYPKFYPAFDRAIYRWKTHYACRRANRIVATSRQTADDLREFLAVPEEKIRVVYQGCHQQFYEQATDARKGIVRKRYGLPGDYILSVGTMERRKNSLIILRALHALGSRCDMPLVLVGKRTGYTAEIVQFARANNLQNRLKIISDVEFGDLPAVYQMAGLFVYPSLFEGFGIPVLEAIISKVPVVASSSSSIPEAGGPNSRYFNPLDSETLAEQIELLIGDGEVRNLQTSSSLVFAERFRPGIIAEDMMRVYREILS